MKEQFRSKRFNTKNRFLLQNCLSILNEYKQKGIKVTLRQLYYQLVARGIILNLDKEYHKISGLLTDARYCGLVDWDAIEDRIRIPHRHSQFDDILDLVESAKYSYRLNRWEDQEYYVELFTEKDALSSVLEPICNTFHIYLNVNRGYSSATAYYDASKRFLEQDEKKCIILYFGDHDPSGLDMIRDIEKRLIEFGCTLDVIPIALTMKQVKQYNPPPNPAKLSDPRAKWYVSAFGGTSWEVDALPPDVMINLVRSSMLKYVDPEKLNKIIEREKVDMKQLEEFAKTLRDKK
jgi:hypothetical protein